MAKEMKKPWVAALLNFLIAGLGYLYVGKRVGFGVGLVLWEVTFLGLSATNELSAIELLSMIMLGLIFAYDGYATAKEANAAK